MLEFQELKRFVYDYEELKRLARRLHRLYEVDCNFGLTPAQEKRQAKLEQQVMEIAQRYNFHAYFQRDPRGLPVYLLQSITDKDYYHTKGIPIKS